LSSPGRSCQERIGVAALPYRKSLTRPDGNDMNVDAAGSLKNRQYVAE